MGVSKGEQFRHQDIFIDYDFEQVMFRWDYIEKKIYRKFYGKAEDLSSVPHDNRLFNDALLNGSQISREEYMLGKPKRVRTNK